MANTGMANPEAPGTQLQMSNTCWKAVVPRLGGWTFLYNTSPVAHSIGHPVIETHRGGLRQQRVLRQHVCGHGISCADKAQTSAFLASKAAKKKKEHGTISLTTPINYKNKPNSQGLFH